MINRKSLMKLLAIGVAAAALWGCSDANPSAPAFREGAHPEGWVFQHGAQFVENAQNCRACHGDELDGGIAGGVAAAGAAKAALNQAAPTCFSPLFNATRCHGSNGPFNPHGGTWLEIHPEQAMKKPIGMEPSNDQSDQLFTSFLSCRRCHGDDFSNTSMPGREAGQTTGVDACVFCHLTFFGVEAPHSAPADWLGKHPDTNPDNGVVCAECHLNRENLSAGSAAGLPPFTFNSGAKPGCFNNTLCHGAIVSHPDGWTDPAVHGQAAKAFPQAPVNGMLNCRGCHGGTLFAESCANACHVPPHAPQWADEATVANPYTHQNTNLYNAPACAACHRNQNNLSAALKAEVSFSYNATADPGCFNNTLCHGQVNPHASGWASPDVHGASAMGDPTLSSANSVVGFLNCQPCHGQRFQTSCAGACHTPPHAPDFGSDHQAVNRKNAPACQPCHPNEAESCATQECHGGNPHPVSGWGSSSSEGAHGDAAKAAPSSTSIRGFSSCATADCHGATFQNTCAGACHSAAHDDDWEGGHDSTNTANATSCAVCHRDNAGTAGCYNNTLCHGNQ